MEKLRRVVKEIAYTTDHSTLPPLRLTLIPLLSLASSLYGVVVSLRHYLYRSGFLTKHRLQVPVISVGNLTWGGNGKTPMVEFIAKLLLDSGILPLILTRGYAGGDEARMLQRHFLSKSVEVGVGANRAATASAFLHNYGYRDAHSKMCSEKVFSEKEARNKPTHKLGAAILDDGMQHLQLVRDLDIVMVNGLQPWGNGRLIPLGPLREPLTALRRAEIAVIHNADMVPKQDLKSTEATLLEVSESIRTFFTRMAPVNFREVGDMNSIIPLEAASDKIVLCISAIGCADAFVQSVEKLGVLHVDQLDFNDHHAFQMREMGVVKGRLRMLESKFGMEPIVILTEKDYDRDPQILKHLSPYRTWALCAELQFIPFEGSNETTFKSLLEELLGIELSPSE